MVSILSLNACGVNDELIYCLRAVVFMELGDNIKKDLLCAWIGSVMKSTESGSQAPHWKAHNTCKCFRGPGALFWPLRASALTCTYQHTDTCMNIIKNKVIPFEW